MSNILTSQNVPTSIQVSILENVLAGNNNFSRGVLIKNITDSELTLEVRLLGMNTFISTTIYPGWNPEIITEIKGVTVNTLQYGY